MAPTTLPEEFAAFLRLLNANGVEYLVVGGYAVAYHGYPRATGDLDVWVRRSPDNARRVVAALQAFGFDLPDLVPALFEVPDRIVRMGRPPLRLEVMTSVSGVTFEACYAERDEIDLGGERVPVLSLARLLENKRASGRPKDLDDLDQLG